MGGGISTNKIEHNNNNNNNNNNNHNNNKQILLYERIKLDYLLGEGGYSEVYHGIDKQTNKSIAVKRINLIKILQNNNNKIIIKDKADKDNNKEKENKDNKKNEGLESLNTIFTELNAFKRIGNHDFIVTLHSAFRHNVCCYLVMDCLSGGDLRHFLKINGSLNEESVVYIVGCIGSALHHMHSRGVIHRDVKPENIGLDTLGRPYLTDFGISLISSVDNPIPISESSSGTLPYLSPEVLSPGNYHSHQSDYWSLGVLAYELFFNRRPYRRHCPIHAIEFVSNEYGWIWNELKQKQQNYYESQLYYEVSPIIDFTKFNRPIDWKPPFPDLNIHLNEDGSVPPCLMVPLPLPLTKPFQTPFSSNSSLSISPIKSRSSSQSSSLYSFHCSSSKTSLPSRRLSRSRLQKSQNVYYSSSSTSSSSRLPTHSSIYYSSKTISEEFRSLLNGLLDVRIPYRLGNMSRYHEFSNHDCFNLYHSTIFSNLSPLLCYTFPTYSPLLQNKSFSSTSSPSLSSTCCSNEKFSLYLQSTFQFSLETEQQLSKFDYCNSSSLFSSTFCLSC